MSLVNITDVAVLDNPTAFLNPFQFEITFECIEELKDDLEWKVVYVGNAENDSGDQVLEEVMVGPVVAGKNKFVLQTEAPNPAMITNRDLIGVTVILITCSYMANRFVQIGYYVNNEYEEEFEPENFPNPVDINKLNRNILSGEPRVTRFAIDWTGGSIPPVANSNSDEANAGEDVPVNEQEEGDALDLEIAEDEEDEEDDEEDDADIEVDLEAEEDMEEDDEGEGEGEGAPSDSDQFVSMEVMNEDSMDVERMLQDEVA